ncbi:MAG TPA: class I SAM-dependent methyltransferase [Burkholderiales bacterium]|nr:class I SAM-dependent methyltransferase [Burkholderiales bacterium]
MIDQTDIFVGGEADAYYQRNGHRPPYGETLRYFVPHIRPGMKVLEVGCNNGLNLRWLEEQIACEGYGAEPSVRAIAGQKNLLRATADRLPYVDESFDVVLLGFCLYLVDRRRLFHAIAEAHRVLRDGGLLGGWDFRVSAPQKRVYRHHPGVWSYKMNYAGLWLANPAYTQIFDDTFEAEGTAIAVWLLRKDEAHAYRITDG